MPIVICSPTSNVAQRQIQFSLLISHGLPVLEQVQQAICVPNNTIPDLEKLLQGPDVLSIIVNAVVKVAKGEPSASAVTLIEESVKTEDQDAETVPFNPADMPKGPSLEDNVNSGISPTMPIAICPPTSNVAQRQIQFSLPLGSNNWLFPPSCQQA